MAFTINAARNSNAIEVLVTNRSTSTSINVSVRVKHALAKSGILGTIGGGSVTHTCVARFAIEAGKTMRDAWTIIGSEYSALLGIVLEFCRFFHKLILLESTLGAIKSCCRGTWDVSKMPLSHPVADSIGRAIDSDIEAVALLELNGGTSGRSFIGGDKLVEKILHIGWKDGTSTKRGGGRRHAGKGNDCVCLGRNEGKKSC
jgi:hypothetical protein